MTDPIINPLIALRQIEEKVADLTKEIKNHNTLKNKDLEKFIQEFKRLSETLKGDISTGISKVDTNVNDRVTNAIEQLIRLGQENTVRDGNVNLSLWRVLNQVKSEIQNHKKKAIVERAGKAELGGGSTDSGRK